MAVVRDRRNEPLDDKYGTDKLRFRDRYLDRVREAIQKKIAQSTLGDLGKGGLQVPIPKSTTREPTFRFGNVDAFHTVFPGNIRFDAGDKIPKPEDEGGGSGNEPGTGSGEDDFVWVSEEEFLDILFEGRKLPDMTKMKGAHLDLMERRHSGYTNKGPAHRLDMGRTDKKRRGDEIILSKMAERRILENLAEQFNILGGPDENAPGLEVRGKTREERARLIDAAVTFATGSGREDLDISDAGSDVSALNAAVAALKQRSAGFLGEAASARIDILDKRLVEQFRAKGRSGNFRDEQLTYEFDEDHPKPGAKAVVFCKMDVSGSMGQDEKNTGKVFFWLMKKFLEETYRQVEIVFIAHTEEAKEVDEQTFFYGTETGGTLVSSCLTLMDKIIKDRYPPGEWNIYSAQVSDGDNVNVDNDVVEQKMENLLPFLQGHYYVEVTSDYRRAYRKGQLSDLGAVYEKLAYRHDGKVRVAGDIMTPADALEAFKYFFPVNATAPVATFKPAASVPA